MVTQPDKKKGRKQQLVYSEVKEVALEYDIPVFQPVKIKSDYQTILDFVPDLIVTCAYGQIVPKEVLDLPKYGCVNLHGSLLPKYRGGAPIQRAIWNGDKVSGMSLMKMAPKMDAGPVLAQKEIEILPEDNSTSLFDKMAICAGELLLSHFEEICSGKAVIQNKKTCAVIMETVQGEGGIYPADPAFIEGVRRLCDEKDILLILDEIQCGMGRTGEMFAWQNYGVKPDIMTCAKALGCGVPVGAFFLTQRVADKSLAPGDHGTTYGGNPFVGAAVSAVFDQFKACDILGHVKEVAPYLEQKLDELVEKYDFLITRRGKGLMQGVVCKLPVGKVAAAALEHAEK